VYFKKLDDPGLYMLEGKTLQVSKISTPFDYEQILPIRASQSAIGRVNISYACLS
jgi:hypothetical protein